MRLLHKYIYKVHYTFDREYHVSIFDCEKLKIDIGSVREKSGNCFSASVGYVWRPL